MMTWVVVPVKPLDQGKSRLRALFSDHEALQFNASLFQNTFLKLRDISLIDQIVVVSQDQRVLGWTMANGGIALAESKHDLNSALGQGLELVQKQGEHPVLILPTDLPLMSVEDLHRVFLSFPSHPGMLIIPDRRKIGTNALFLTKPDLINPVFGQNSFQKHCAMAESKHYQLVVYLDQHIQHDIDTPDDLRLIQGQVLVNQNY